tara:strand:- start:9520 stop:9678 length:159 start_codon:yes stop_codon:yes gene_type:complete
MSLLLEGALDLGRENPRDNVEDGMSRSRIFAWAGHQDGDRCTRRFLCTLYKM